MRELIQEGPGWRLSLVVDELDYDDSYIDTWDDISDEEKAQAKRELWERIERDGVWCLDGQVQCTSCGTWESIDHCCGFVGMDWKDSGYDSDILSRIQEEAAKRREAA